MALTLDKLADWKRGRIPYLEGVITTNLSKISKEMQAFQSWVIHSKLKPRVTVYQHGSQPLRFSKTGRLDIEIAYRTHYVLLEPHLKKESADPLEKVKRV